MENPFQPNANSFYKKPRFLMAKPSNSKHFQNDFNKWTSGNGKINKLIQDAQINANHYGEVIEWIPYDRFKDVKQIDKGGFGTMHYARWIDGSIKNGILKINNGNDTIKMEKWQ
ncbi:hypothetical protein Glove_151g130 [Diversispora epigaea]|uniref:Protein kinase domain-containing protein n=1 Tax=Diversispora epigaea TaxID=1348612 RepID=A0A397IVV5_9GLOM|nr:hypothetical protein Glove_151g130 [Diversispora epigaea]